MFFKITEFADFYICPWTIVAKNEVCMANEKMKKVRTCIASRIPLEKTNVLKDALFPRFCLFFFARNWSPIFVELVLDELVIGNNKPTQSGFTLS